MDRCLIPHWFLVPQEMLIYSNKIKWLTKKKRQKTKPSEPCGYLDRTPRRPHKPDLTVLGFLQSVHFSSQAIERLYQSLMRAASVSQDYISSNLNLTPGAGADNFSISAHWYMVYGVRVKFGIHVETKLRLYDMLYMAAFTVLASVVYFYLRIHWKSKSSYKPNEWFLKDRVYCHHYQCFSHLVCH
jgi:hypothetical protein